MGDLNLNFHAMVAKAKKGEKLTKEGVVERVAQAAGISNAEAKKTVNALIGVVTDTLANGGEANITGFGKFHAVARAAKNGVNPKTGEKIRIAARTSPAFKAGTGLKEALGN